MTAKRKRWAVWRDTTMEAHHDNPWIGAPERHWVYRYAGHAFPTHAEALAHADRMARTVEVTLPRIGTKFTYKQQTNPYYDDITITKANSNNYQIRYAEDIGTDGRGIDMLANELKPVALALLAHHYKNQPTPKNHQNTTC